MKKSLMQSYPNKMSLIFITIIINLTVTSCQSILRSGDEDRENRIVALEKDLIHLKFQVTNLEQDNTIHKKIISSLQNDVLSQSEEIATQRKNIDVLKRGLRSGVFEEFPEDKTETPKKNSNQRMLPDISYGRNGFQENPSPITASLLDKKKNDGDPLDPKQLLAKAEMKIRRAEYKDGLIKLDELKQNYPNFEDNGQVFLLSAEAWLKLKEYEYVIPEIKSFYFKYPTSADLAYAKLLEGQAYEGIGTFEKAAALYNEVISLSPRSTLAQSAQEGMLRMRDQK